jgi:hypothetical protein
MKARRQDVEAVMRGQIKDKCIVENALKLGAGIVKGELKAWWTRSKAPKTWRTFGWRAMKSTPATV